MRRQHLLFLLGIVLFFSRCQKEPAYIGGPDTTLTTPEPVTAHLQGNIADENGQPASGALVRVGNKTTLTDSKGYFRITDAALDKKAALVTVEKAGYFKAYRTFSANTGTNQVEIKLIKRSNAGSVSATSGGDVSLSNGTKISLPANGIVVASSGAAYNGTVNVYAAYIDPTAADIDQRIPGSLMADDKTGSRVLLTSYGMLAVELEGSAGEKLQIKSGAVANLTTPIPAAAQASAPASISMWYVDDQSGLWKEEGAATKQGGSYVADVKHFTYWNCDLPVPTIFFTATLKDANGKPIVNASVAIRPASGTYGGYAHGFTDSLGQVSGPIPANMNLVLQVLGPCNTPVYSQNIGPYTQNVNFGTITIPASTSSYVTIKGNLQTCSGTNVVNGYALVVLDNRVHYAATDASGNFSTNYFICSGSGTATVLAVDGAGQQQGNPLTVTVNSGTNDVGTLSACGIASNEFINYTVDGTAYNISTQAKDSMVAFASGQGQATTLMHYITGSHNATNNISFQFSTPSAGGTGTYNVLGLRVLNTVAGIKQPFTVNLTNYAASVGQFYEGSISGQYTDSLSSGTTVHTLSATFKVRRIQ